MANKKKTAVGLGMVVCCMLGVGLGILLANALRWILGDVENVFLAYAFIVAVFIVALIVQLIAHEAGHLIFGLLTGYRFSSFRIFSFTWVKIDGKIRFKRMSLVGTGGQCLLLPPPLVEGKLPTVWYNLGGVLVNLFLSAVTAIPVLLCEQPYLRLGFLVFAAVGLITALTNGIPMRVSGVDNDGKNALSLRKNEKAAYAFWLQLQINGTIASGVSLKNMPVEWFELPEKEDMQNPLIATRAVFRENYLMDKGEFDEAKTLIAELLASNANLIGIYEKLLRCDLAYLLLLEGKGEEVTPLWTKELVAFQKSMRNFPAVIRTQYAYALLLEGNEQKANELSARFEKVSKSYPYETDIQTERGLIAFAKQKKEEKVEG